MTTNATREWTTTWTSAAQALWGAVQGTDKKYLTLVDVMGLSGHAFRMNVDPKKVNAAGPTSFPGGYIFRRNLANLGFVTNMGEASVPVSPAHAEQTIALVQKSIDQGIPAIAFDLFIPEFGNIYGYDDEQRVFYAKDVSQDGTIPYQRFVEPKIHVLFLITIADSIPHSKYEMLRMALDMIVDHARGREWNHEFKGNFAMGLDGYDAWIGVMKRREADEFGNAYNVAVVADAREFAAEFLRRMAADWSADNYVERTVRAKAAEAAVHYGNVAEAFGRIREQFPFPQGGTPNEASVADRTIAWLEEAKEAETKGVAVLEGLLDFMKAYYSEVWVH